MESECKHVQSANPRQAGVCAKCGRKIQPDTPRQQLVLVRDGWRVLPKMMVLPDDAG